MSATTYPTGLDLATMAVDHASVIKLAMVEDEPEMLPWICMLADGVMPAHARDWQYVAQECRMQLDALWLGIHMANEEDKDASLQQIEAFEAGMAAGSLLSLALQAMGWESPYKGISEGENK